MSLVTTQEILREAQQNGYAVVGIAAYNLETIRTLVETADKLRSPIIIQTTPGTIENAGIEYFSSIVKIAAGKVSIPVALHLDHGDTLERVKLCLEHGYTSIMIDGSSMPYEENVSLVQKAVKMAHEKGVPVEAELGQIGGVEDNLFFNEENVGYTDPNLAVDFVERTGIDSLAIAIGTAHGLYKGEPKLDLERLSIIRHRVSVPLVLHGASGLPDDTIRDTIRRGIVKINIATDVKISFANALRQFLCENPNESDPRKYFKAAKQAYAAAIEEKIRLVGSNNRLRS